MNDKELRSTLLVLAVGAAVLYWTQRVGAQGGAPLVDDPSGDVLSPAGNYGGGLIAFAQAIAHAEGFGVPGAVPTRAHNPGDLANGNIGHGVTGAENITIFASDADGWTALYRQLARIRDGRSRAYGLNETLGSIAAKYAPGQPEWLANVIDHLQNDGYSVDADTAAAEVLNG